MSRSWNGIACIYTSYSHLAGLWGASLLHTLNSVTEGSNINPFAFSKNLIHLTWEYVAILCTVWYIKSPFSDCGNTATSGIQYNNCPTGLHSISLVLQKLKRLLQFAINLRTNSRCRKCNNSALLPEFLFTEYMEYPLTTDFPKALRSFLLYVFLKEKKKGFKYYKIHVMLIYIVEWIVIYVRFKYCKRYSLLKLL